MRRIAPASSTTTTSNRTPATPHSGWTASKASAAPINLIAERVLLGTIIATSGVIDDVYLDAGDHKRAAKLFEDVLERFDDKLTMKARAEALIGLGTARMHLGALDEAVGPLSEAADLDPPRRHLPGTWTPKNPFG